MSRRWLTIRLHSYWHAGTGAGDGAGADAVVQRDAVGLPMLPGSHLRGLMRHALRFAEEDCGVIDPPMDDDAPDTWADLLFGAGPSDAGASATRPPRSRYETWPGQVSVGDARLPRAWQAFAAGSPKALAPLFATLQSTRIGADGLVTPRTLRSTEVTVPMVLNAPLDGLDAAGEAALAKALGLIKAVGKHRTRGLGRATLTLSSQEVTE